MYTEWMLLQASVQSAVAGNKSFIPVYSADIYFIIHLEFWIITSQRLIY